MDDHYDLKHFVIAQNRVYEKVLDELAAGKKRGHWMWYIFPQVTGLGRSTVAKEFAIASIEEARAYSEHPVLGPRLIQCTQLVINVTGRSVEQIFYYPDNLKFRSSMTLFIASTPQNGLFREALRKYFGGDPDQSTLDTLKQL